MRAPTRRRRGGPGRWRGPSRGAPAPRTRSSLMRDRRGPDRRPRDGPHPRRGTGCRRTRPSRSRLKSSGSTLRDAPDRKSTTHVNESWTAPLSIQLPPVTS
jgi:hypothetical protein